MEYVVSAIIVAVLSGIILLFVEYRTKWFANHVPEPNKASKALNNKFDVADIIYKAKLGIQKIHNIPVEEITVKSWEHQKRKRRLRLLVKTSDKISKTIVWVDYSGSILHERGEFAIYDTDGFD